jgi:hypothetical protein
MESSVDGLLGVLGGLLGLSLMIPFLVFGLTLFLLVAWPFRGFIAASYVDGSREGRRQRLKARRERPAKA